MTQQAQTIAEALKTDPVYVTNAAKGEINDTLLQKAETKIDNLDFDVFVIVTGDEGADRDLLEQIKQVRRSRGLTQERLAEALSVSVGYISQMERGVTKINLDTLAAVSSCLGCELSELVTGVSVHHGRYLERELAQLVERMDARQRRLLLAIARLLLSEGSPL